MPAEIFDVIVIIGGGLVGALALMLSGPIWL